MSRHVLSALTSVVLAALVAVLTNVFTDGWLWPVGAALVVAVVVQGAWEAVRSRRASPAAVRVTGTGAAIARGVDSRANTGIVGSSSDAELRATGDARAEDGGIANTGFDSADGR